MKTLYVLRHSKAGQTNKNILDDHERALTEKGIRLCHAVADELKRIKTKPDVVFSSTAKRCIETYEQIKPHYPLNCPLETSSQLYLADAMEIVKQVRKLSADYASALLIGHNPGLHEFCLQITARKSDRKMQKDLKNQFSPPTLVKFEFDISDWKSIAFDGGLLTHYFCAKEGKND